MEGSAAAMEAVAAKVAKEGAATAAQEVAAKVAEPVAQAPRVAKP